MKKKSFDQIVTIEIEMELSEYVLCEVTQKCANDVHGNVLCVSMCVCVNSWHVHYTITTSQLNWNIRPRFLLYDANYIVQGENKWHVHFSMLTTATTVAATKVGAAALNTTTTTTMTAALAASCVATATCLLPDLLYNTKLIPNSSVNSLVCSFVCISDIIHCSLYPRSRWKMCYCLMGASTVQSFICFYWLLFRYISIDSGINEYFNGF